MERMVQMMTWVENVKGMLKDEKGQGMVEYGLILALVAVVVAAAFTTLQVDLTALLKSVGGQLNP